MVAATIMEIDDRDLRKQLGALLARGQDMKPALREIGEDWVTSVKANLSAGGRPRKWPKTSAGDTSRLIRTRRLYRSFTARASSDDVMVGTKVRYARLMHFGGVVRPRRSRYLAIPIGQRRELQAGARAFIRRQPKGSIFMTFKSGGRGTIFRRGANGVEAVFALRRKVKLPPRPFLMAQRQDIANFHRILGRHLLGGLA